MTKVLDSQRKIALLLGFGVVLTRLPFLGHGYGTDPDAWRVMIAAQRFLDTGIYLPSRRPGYPIPEYFDAAMIGVGLGSSFWIGLLATVLSGIACALLFLVLWPLGLVRALAGALALAFTPAVYVAGLGAMDYLWGLAFVLAATVFATQRRVWPACLFLGLAMASRPTYVLAAVSIALLLAIPWKRLVLPLICSAIMAFAFYVPEIVVLGRSVIWAGEGTENFQRALFYASIGVFGVFGFVAIIGAIASAVLNRRNGVQCDVGKRTDQWALGLIVVYGILFVFMPQDPAYLFPALPGLYWILSRYAHQVGVWVMVTSLVVSCFAIKINGKPLRVSFKGPVLWETQEQAQRQCVAAWLRDWLAANEDSYVVVGFYRPQLAVQMGRPYSDRILYTVRPADGGLRDTEPWEKSFPDSPAWLPSTAKVLVLDHRADQQESVWPENKLPVLSMGDRCR